MPKARSSHSRIDVSGDTDERGRVINRDIPEEARRSGVKKKKRVDQRKAKAEIVIDDSPPAKKRKKRKVVEEELPTVKKKKKKSKALALVDGPPTTKALGKLERRKAKLEQDLLYLPAENGNDEFDRQYRAMFDKLQQIIEIFEENMLSGTPNGRDVYALSTLYSQMREVIADMRSAKDVSSQIAELEAKAYGAFLNSVGQNFIDVYFKLSKDIRTFVKDKEAQLQLLGSLDGIIKDESDKITGNYQLMLERVRTVLT
ncbi:hypothetical protein D3C85_475820 [compost metagenome]